MGEMTSELRKHPASEKDTTASFGPGAAPLLDSYEAARFLGVHPRTLQRMVLRGQINGVRVGKLWRFVPSSLQAWITEHNIAS
jgi:excisionase family DNA binding protein